MRLPTQSEKLYYYYYYWRSRQYHITYSAPNQSCAAYATGVSTYSLRTDCVVSQSVSQADDGIMTKSTVLFAIAYRHFAMMTATNAHRAVDTHFFFPFSYEFFFFFFSFHIFTSFALAHTTNWIDMYVCVCVCESVSVSTLLIARHSST